MNQLNNYWFLLQWVMVTCEVMVFVTSHPTGYIVHFSRQMNMSRISLYLTSDNECVHVDVFTNRLTKILPLFFLVKATSRLLSVIITDSYFIEEQRSKASKSTMIMKSRLVCWLQTWELFFFFLVQLKDCTFNFI